MNQRCALTPDLESILRARTDKIVLQHNPPKADIRPKPAFSPRAARSYGCLTRPKSVRGSDRLASGVEPLVQHIVHAGPIYIVAGCDRVLIFASPMSEPDINRVIEHQSVRHWSRLPAAITIPVTKAARHENSSRSCRMRAIGNLLYAAPRNRSEQSCR